MNPTPSRVWFFYDNQREIQCTFISLSHDEAQSATLEAISLPIATHLSAKLGNQITTNLNFWKLFEPLPKLSLLSPNMLLETVAERQVPDFSVSQYISSNLVNLVVRWIPPRGEKRDREETAGAMLERIKHAKIATEAPSYAAKSSQYRSWHIKQCTFVDYRPEESPGDESPSAYYLPMSLHYEGFGHFLDIFRGRDHVSGLEKVRYSTLQRAVDKFAKEMSRVFPDELSRRTAGLDALNEIINARTDQLNLCLMPSGFDSKSSSDGHFIGNHKVACCIVEFKNEPGTGSAIPYVELAGHFAHSIKAASANDDSVKMMLGWNVPCLGITIDGIFITFYAMLFVGDGQWHVVSLTPGLSCIRVAGDGDDRTALYKAFSAASVLLAHIYEKANQMVFNPPLPIQGSRMLPRISSLRHPLSGSRIEFNIVEPFLFVPADRHLFFAQTTDGKKILVKFARRYSYDLHVFCAERGCAPALLGFERLPGDIFGVAMEFVASSQIACFAEDPKARGWATLLQELVQSFHAEGLVHGDLRSPNILCDGDRVLIVDFDWGGKEGRVSYPRGDLTFDLMHGRANKEDVRIRKEDDLRVLCKTLGYMGLKCDYCQPRSGTLE